MKVIPMKFPNKSNKRFIQGGGGGDAKELAEADSTGGVIKFASLMGCLLNNKNDKKGYHDTFRDWVRETRNRGLTFPDTSNTRYSSYLDACSEVLAHFETYVEFFKYIRGLRSYVGHNSMEDNIWNGLQDKCTLTEMAVMVLYQEAISHPYIIAVRGPGLTGSNALDNGPLLQSVVDHID